MNKAQKQKVREELESIGFGNQARIVGAKRVELYSYLIQKLEEQERELVQDIEIKVINPCDYEDVHKAWKLFTSYLKQDENKR